MMDHTTDHTDHPSEGHRELAAQLGYTYGFYLPRTTEDIEGGENGGQRPRVEDGLSPTKPDCHPCTELSPRDKGQVLTTIDCNQRREAVKRRLSLDEPEQEITVVKKRRRKNPTKTAGKVD